MKQTRWIIALVVLLFGASLAGASSGDGDRDGDVFISKTYRLQYVTSERVVKKLGRYLIDHSPVQVMNVITVKIMRKDEEEFDFQMRQLDVPKNRSRGGLVGKILSVPRRLFDLVERDEPPAAERIIQFRIYTVLASPREGPGGVDDPDLDRVLAEMSDVLKFKSYQLDGVSMVQVGNYSERNSLRLNSRRAGLTMRLDHVLIEYERDGRQVVAIGRLEVHDDSGAFISTRTSINRNGYLVVGVTPPGDGGDSLAIILYAELH
ncbi:MAG: hypothetical protein JXO51_05320 [Candidatus Aminicenantes bacterium]|nr:hypothetical protein [Candidatus Aminicenantes bacterium]